MSWCCFRPIKRRNDLQHQESLRVFSSDKNIKLFSYGELKSATDNFHQGNKIGRGGFGTVYKGTLRSGQEVAVKVLSAESRQGVKEFLTEIDVITNVKHPNLVELVGCCVEADNRILIYEYLENNSLDHALLGPNSDPSKLDWNTRSAICLGVAKGLAYLHEELEPHIVHRDIKASNILIDRNFVPKIGDFGLAKLFPDNITHISTRVAGTTGYLAPEYALHGQLTRKADIYSFGVLILEIVSGRSSSKMLWTEMDKLLLEWIWQLYEEGRLKEAVDPVLKEYPEEQVIQYIKVALFCTQAAAGRRPSIQQVVEMMSKTIKLNEKELTPPGYVDDSTFKASKATNSSNSRFKDSYSRGTTAPFTSNAITFSDMIPR
ncbi:putative serine/threonine-protein kinase isoform X1 [Typha latifolia]|uniref:putative serine/threonine-protein kinase isoform X1 n=1 Tax=Typha latifolia TaxID=4733 RepID=UPI003C2DD5A7